MIDEWPKEVKQRANPEYLGIILVHNGIVRGNFKVGESRAGHEAVVRSEKTKCCIQQRSATHEPKTSLGVW